MTRNQFINALFAVGIFTSMWAAPMHATAHESCENSEAANVDEDAARLVKIWLERPGDITPLSLLASESAMNESSEIRPLYVWTIAKKALIWALRHHADDIVKKLPAKWRGPVGKNAKKLANLLETFEEWKEGACIIGLTSMGIPPSDSQIMCQAISWLL